MRKGERTRQRIIEQAMPIFNTRGFAWASLNELSEAVGLEKGALYNHFASKEELALAAFDYAVELMTAAMATAIAAHTSASAQLIAMLNVQHSIADESLLRGGCPLLNAAIESDDTSPQLRERAQQAMTLWHRLIGKLIKVGKQQGEFRTDVDPYHVASILTATLEGAVMLSKLYGDQSYIERAITHLTGYIHSLEVKD
jgi:AcrR family transcriptional regulator